MDHLAELFIVKSEIKYVLGNIILIYLFEVNSAFGITIHFRCGMNFHLKNETAIVVMFPMSGTKQEHEIENKS